VLVGIHAPSATVPLQKASQQSVPSVQGHVRDQTTIFGAQHSRTGQNKTLHDKTTGLQRPTVHELALTDISAQDLCRDLMNLHMPGKISLPQNSHSRAGYTISEPGQDYGHLYQVLVLTFSARDGPVLRNSCPRRGDDVGL
jgi:hypothetical protein